MNRVAARQCRSATKKWPNFSSPDRSSWEAVTGQFSSVTRKIFEPYFNDRKILWINFVDLGTLPIDPC